MAVLLSIGLCGCELLRKRAAVSTPPPPKPSASAPAPAPAPVTDEPLSIPQTRAKLPAPQPITPEALASIPPRPVQLDAPPNPQPQVSARKPPASSPAPVAAPPTKEAKPAQEPERPAIETMLPEEARRQLVNEIEGRLKKTQDMLSRVHPRKLSAEQRDVVARIRSFVQLSNEALKRGDTTQAGELADRALLLAGDLSRGQ